MRSRNGMFVWISGLAVAATLWHPPAVQAQGDAAGEERVEVDAAGKRLLAASGLYRRGRFEAAVEEYGAFLEQYPKHEQAAAARYGKGAAHFQLGQYEQAAAEMRAALADDDFEQRPDALFVLGQALVRAGEVEAALEPLGELADGHADSPRAAVAATARVQALLALGRNQEAANAAGERLEATKDAGADASLLYLAGIAQSRLGQHAAATDSLTRLLEAAPNAPFLADATLLLGQSLEATGEVDAAGARYEGLVERLPEDRRDAARYSLGVLRYKQARYEDAVTQLRAIARETPQSPYRDAAALQLGAALLAAGKGDEARDVLQPLTEREEDPAAEGVSAVAPQAEYWLAQVDLEAGRYSEAAARLDGLLDRKPPVGNVEAVMFDRALAISLAGEEGAAERAASAFAEYRKQHPDLPRASEAAYRQAFAEYQRGEYEAALALAEGVAGGDSAFKSDAEELVGESQLRLERNAAAAETFHRLAEAAGAAKGDASADRRASLLLRSGRALFAAGDYEAAAARLEPVVQRKNVAREESLREALYLSANAKLQTGDDQAAAELFDRYQEEAPEGRRTEVAYQAAVARLRAGDGAAARKGFEAAMRDVASSTWAQRAALQFAQIASRDSDLDAARKALDSLLKANPPADLDAPATYLLGTVQLRQEQAAQAAETFAAVMKRHADHPLADDAAYQRAVALRAAGDEEGAIAAAGEYLKQRPDGGHVAEARYLLGVASADTGNARAAIEQLEPLAESDATRTPRVLYDLAWAYRQGDRGDDAIATYRRLLDAEGGADLKPSARAELGELLYQAEDYAAATEPLRAAADDEKGPDEARQNAAYRLGWALVKAGEPAEAAGAFAGFAQQYPKHDLAADATYQSAAASITAGDLAAAEERLATLLADYQQSPLAERAALQLGDVRLDRGRYPQAAEAYRRYLEQYKDADDRYRAQFGVGFALQNQDQLDEAREWYSRVTQSHNGETAARAQYQIGTLYIKQKQPEKAVDELMKVDIIYDAPKWAATALVEAGGVLETQKKPEEAAKLYGRVLDDYPDTEAAPLARKRLAGLEK